MQVKDHILESNQKYCNSKATNIVFVDEATYTYTAPAEIGFNTDSVLAPFAGRDPDECAITLRQIREKTNSLDIDCDHFAVFDNRSVIDGTLLLVAKTKEKDREQLNCVRVVCDLVESRLQQYAIDEAALQMDRREVANTRDGAVQAFKPHVPDPTVFIPPSLRRELLLDNGDRILVGSSDLDKNWEGEIFFLGRTTARVVRELLGDEKSPPFRPSTSNG